MVQCPEGMSNEEHLAAMAEDLRNIEHGLEYKRTGYMVDKKVEKMKAIGDLNRKIYGNRQLLPTQGNNNQRRSKPVQGIRA